MARLDERPDYYGTYDNICVYNMYGKDFMRGASSLTGERVKKDPAFEKTMAWAGRMATASRLAAAVYAMLSPCRRKFPFYRKLTGQAVKLLKEGREEGDVVVELMIAIRLPKRPARKKPVQRTVTKSNTRYKVYKTAPIRRATVRRLKPTLFIPFPIPQKVVGYDHSPPGHNYSGPPIRIVHLRCISSA